MIHSTETTRTIKAEAAWVLLNSVDFESDMNELLSHGILKDIKTILQTLGNKDVFLTMQCLTIYEEILKQGSNLNSDIKD